MSLHDVLVSIGIGAPLPFTSPEFWLFFAVVAGALYTLRMPLGKLALLAASYYFYARWNEKYVLFLFALTASDFVIGRSLERQKRGRKALLALGVGLNLLFLGTIKYANFATAGLSRLLGMPEDPWFVALIVPIGISFHTFQSISYLVDVYRRRMTAVRNPLDYALYIAFFPQLMAGPIVRAENFFADLYRWHAPAAAEVSRAAGEIAIGLVKKTVLADQFGVLADAYFGAPAAHPGAPAAWSGALAFAFQIYFDFSGYSDIAIGTARLLGFPFPQNFRRPYLATSFRDFWRRWHISLSTWLRDYLYIPLGGNRHGRWMTVRNLMITMLLGGLWHGAGWTFVLWGGYHGALLSFEHLTGRQAFAGTEPRNRALRLFGVLATFFFVLLGWVVFRAPGIPEAARTYAAMFAGGGGAWLIPAWLLALAMLAFVLEARADAGKPFVDWRNPRLPRAAASLAALLIALLLLSYPGESVPFVYFKF